MFLIHFTYKEVKSFNFFVYSLTFPVVNHYLLNEVLGSSSVSTIKFKAFLKLEKELLKPISQY